MATNVILPALGMAQESGKIVQWHKAEGEQVAKGDVLAEIETDKATVELEAPAAGVLSGITAPNGTEVPVGQVIALILAPGDMPPKVSSLASRIADEYNVDLRLVTPTGKRIQKADVLHYLAEQGKASSTVPEAAAPGRFASTGNMPRLAAASPKARRLANEQGIDLATLAGSGPGGAVLTGDVLAAKEPRIAPASSGAVVGPLEAQEQAISSVWRLMAERTMQSWTGVPHFFLVREVNVSRLISWREHLLNHAASAEKITYSDLLVKIVARALRLHPYMNASWKGGTILSHDEVNVGLAVATGDGLVVPVLRGADSLGLDQIAQRRKEMVARAQGGKLRPQDLQGGTFTISNLGMYGVDAFNAIINAPQAAILAVGRIAERVVPLHGQPVVQPMMTLTLSCDHRVIDGARGAQFLSTLAALVEEPLDLLR